MPLLKKLTPVGNSLGVILDRPVLDMVGISRDTILELTAEQGAIMIRPAVQASARKVMKAHRATLKKLADG